MGCGVQKSGAELVQTPLSRDSQLLVLSPLFTYKENPRLFSEEYELGELLGSNARAEVFLCKHRASGEVRVAKLYSTKLHTLTNGSCDALLAEAEIMLSLKHSNLLRTLEYFNDGSSLTLVTENCSGATLLEVQAAKTRFTENQAAVIIKQLSIAIKHMHKNSVMLRGLSPEKIRFMSPETCKKLKIINYSRACKYMRGGLERQRTSPLPFMSPEMLNGSYNELCDEWSLGVLMYMLMSGQTPFEASKPQDVMDKISAMDYRLDKGIWVRISQEAKELISSLLTPAGKRMTAATVVYHRWIQKYINPNEPESPLIPPGMESLLSPVALKQAAAQLSKVQTSTTSDLHRLKAAVARVDVGECGWLLKSQLLAIVAHEAFNQLSLSEVEAAIVAAGVDARGRVRYLRVYKELEEHRSLFARYGPQLVSESTLIEPVAESMRVLDVSQDPASA